MTTWHPPIPAGRLYSEDALDLGPALALLVWCYDQIDRDGRIEVQLAQASQEIGKPYGTVKDWWRLLRAGPFFCEQIDRGRRGWMVRMAEDWIDWHVMANNYPSKSDEGRDVSLDDDPSSLAQGRDVNSESGEVSVKAASRRRQGRDVSLETSAYKVDQHDHDSGDRRAIFLRDPPGDHQRLMAAYQDALGYTIPNGAKEAAAAKKILTAGYTVEQAIDTYQTLKMRDFYSRQHLSLQTVHEQIGAVLKAPKVSTNGTYPNGRHAAASSRRSGAVPKRLDRDDSG